MEWICLRDCMEVSHREEHLEHSKRICQESNANWVTGIKAIAVRDTQSLGWRMRRNRTQIRITVWLRDRTQIAIYCWFRSWLIKLESTWKLKCDWEIPLITMNTWFLHQGCRLAEVGIEGIHSNRALLDWIKHSYRTRREVECRGLQGWRIIKQLHLLNLKSITTCSRSKVCRCYVRLAYQLMRTTKYIQYKKSSKSRTIHYRSVLIG
jgi:hypothetical protein